MTDDSIADSKPGIYLHPHLGGLEFRRSSGRVAEMRSRNQLLCSPVAGIVSDWLLRLSQ